MAICGPNSKYNGKNVMCKAAEFFSIQEYNLSSEKKKIQYAQKRDIKMLTAVIISGYWIME